MAKKQADVKVTIVVGEKISVSTGILTVRDFDKKEGTVTCWYEANNPTYSKEVQMGADHWKSLCDIYHRK